MQGSRLLGSTGNKRRHNLQMFILLPINRFGDGCVIVQKVLGVSRPRYTRSGQITSSEIRLAEVEHVDHQTFLIQPIAGHLIEARSDDTAIFN